MSEPHKVLTDAELAGKLWDENRALGSSNNDMLEALQEIHSLAYGDDAHDLDDADALDRIRAIAWSKIGRYRK